MYTNQEIKNLISQLDINQLKSILSHFYLKNENNGKSIYNRLNNVSVTYDSLKYELTELIISDSIDIIEVILEIDC
jgi:hypothetical protein